MTRVSTKTCVFPLLLVVALAIVDPSAYGTEAPEPGEEPPPRTVGELIAFSLRGDIYTVQPDGSKLRRLIESPDASCSAPQFSPDGRRLAYIIDQRRVVVVDALDVASILSDIDLYLDRTPPKPVLSDWSLGPIAVHWSPDGKKLLVTRQRLGGSGASDVLLVNDDGTNPQPLLRAGVFIEATWWREPDRMPRVVVLAEDEAMTANLYDLRGHRVGTGRPATATRPAVASLQHPGNDSVLVRSTLGSPKPLGPIQIEGAHGLSTVASGCGATWSPGGERIALYTGDGIALKDPGAPAEDIRLIVTNQALGVKDENDPGHELCAGLGISWSAEAASGR